jgi:hypothetical protein
MEPRGIIRSYFWLPVLLLAIPLAIGCNRNSTPALIAGTPAQGSTTPAASPQDVPFHEPDEKTEGISPSESLVPTPQRVPAGTAIIVRLESGVSSATAQAGDRFEAVLDEPIVAGGQTIAPRGAQVTGKVLSAKPSGHPQDPGYLRVALASITIGGKPVVVQSSSISVRGKSHEKHNWAIGGTTAPGAPIIGAAAGGKDASIGGTVGGPGGTGFAFANGKKDVGFGAERRLTFRLTGALDLKG